MALAATVGHKELKEQRVERPWLPYFQPMRSECTERHGSGYDADEGYRDTTSRI